MLLYWFNTEAINNDVYQLPPSSPVTSTSSISTMLRIRLKRCFIFIYFIWKMDKTVINDDYSNWNNSYNRCNNIVIVKIMDLLCSFSICTDCKFTLFFLNITKFKITFSISNKKTCSLDQNNILFKRKKFNYNKLFFNYFINSYKMS